MWDIFRFPSGPPIRLLATIVIFYNALLLCRLYEHYLIKEPDKAKVITRMSPVAWQHLSFLGKYEFCNKDNIINIQKVIENLLTNPKIDFSAESPVS